eukprot:jgi/Mesvir1/27544/Mv24204-RA.1
MHQPAAECAYCTSRGPATLGRMLISAAGQGAEEAEEGGQGGEGEGRPEEKYGSLDGALSMGRQGACTSVPRWHYALGTLVRKISATWRALDDDLCCALGGTGLVSIHDAADNADVRALCGTSSGSFCWIGYIFTGLNGGWTWSDFQERSYEVWAGSGGAPALPATAISGEQLFCAGIQGADGAWAAQDCTLANAGVCETTRGAADASCPRGWSPMTTNSSRCIRRVALDWHGAHADICPSLGARGLTSVITVGQWLELNRTLAGGLSGMWNGAVVATSYSGGFPTFMYAGGRTVGGARALDLLLASNQVPTQCGTFGSLGASARPCGNTTVGVAVCEAIACPEGWYAAAGTCLTLGQSTHPWADARAECQALATGADLASPLTPDEIDVAAQLCDEAGYSAATQGCWLRRAPFLGGPGNESCEVLYRVANGSIAWGPGNCTELVTAPLCQMGQLTPGENEDCPPPWTPSGASPVSCFRSFKATWQGSHTSICPALNGSGLALVKNTSSLNDDVSRLCGHRLCWVGLSRWPLASPSELRWADNSPYIEPGFSVWGFGQSPASATGKACVAVYGPTGRWYFVECEFPRAAVCEAPMTPDTGNGCPGPAWSPSSDGTRCLLLAEPSYTFLEAALCPSAGGRLASLSNAASWRTAGKLCDEGSLAGCFTGLGKGVVPGGNVTNLDGTTNYFLEWATGQPKHWSLVVADGSNVDGDGSNSDGGTNGSFISGSAIRGQCVELLGGLARLVDCTIARTGICQRVPGTQPPSRDAVRAPPVSCPGSLYSPDGVALTDASGRAAVRGPDVCLRRTATRMTWADARAWCADYGSSSTGGGGYLVEIGNAHLGAAVQEVCLGEDGLGGPGCYVGLSDEAQDGLFAWEGSGSTPAGLNYTNWALGGDVDVFSVVDCGVVNVTAGGGGGWYTNDCEASLYGVCAVSASGDGGEGALAVAKLALGTFTGADESEGLDLTGHFLFQANVNSSSSAPPWTSEGASPALFIARNQATASGTLLASASFSGGSNASDAALATVLSKAAGSDGRIMLELAGLVAGGRYKLQLLWTERSSVTRAWDAYHGGRMVYRGLAPGRLVPPGASVEQGVVLSYEFVAHASLVTVTLWGNRDPGIPKETVLLHAATLESLSGPPPPPPLSCFEILQSGLSHGDADDYVISVNGETARTSCDMTRGGWTKVVSLHGPFSPPGIYATAAGNNPAGLFIDAGEDELAAASRTEDGLLRSGQVAVLGGGKLSDEAIRAINPSSVFRLECGWGANTVPNGAVFVTNLERTWTSVVGNAYRWRVDEQGLGRFDRNGTSADRAATFVTYEEMGTRAKPYGSGNGCFRGNAFGRHGALWAAPPPSSRCPPGWAESAPLGKCVRGLSAGWQDYELAVCPALGGPFAGLVAINNQTDMDDVAAVCRGETPAGQPVACWVGLRDAELNGTWAWSPRGTGDPGNASRALSVGGYAPWGGLEPSGVGVNGCGSVVDDGAGGASLYAWECGTSMAAVCSFPLVTAARHISIVILTASSSQADATRYTTSGPSVTFTGAGGQSQTDSLFQGSSPELVSYSTQLPFDPVNVTISTTNTDAWAIGSLEIRSGLRMCGHGVVMPRWLDGLPFDASGSYYGAPYTTGFTVSLTDCVSRDGACPPGWRLLRNREHCVRRADVDWTTGQASLCPSLGGKGLLVPSSSTDETLLVSVCSALAPPATAIMPYCALGVRKLSSVDGALDYANVDGSPLTSSLLAAVTSDGGNASAPCLVLASGAPTYAGSSCGESGGVVCEGAMDYTTTAATPFPNEPCALGWIRGRPGGPCLRVFRSHWQGHMDTLAPALNASGLVGSMMLTNATAPGNPALTPMTDDLDLEAIASACGVDSRCWVGVWETGPGTGVWVWASGVPVDIFFWAAGEPAVNGKMGVDGLPGRRCVQVYGGTARWHAVDCGVAAGGLFERPVSEGYPRCPSGWTLLPRADRCVRGIHADADTAHSLICPAVGGALASVTTPGDHSAIAHLCFDEEPRACTVGIRRAPWTRTNTTGAWRNVIDGSTPYFAWASGQPASDPVAPVLEAQGGFVHPNRRECYAVVGAEGFVRWCFEDGDFVCQKLPLSPEAMAVPFVLPAGSVAPVDVTIVPFTGPSTSGESGTWMLAYPQHGADLPQAKVINLGSNGVPPDDPLWVEYDDALVRLDVTSGGINDSFASPQFAMGNVSLSAGASSDAALAHAMASAVVGPYVALQIDLTYVTSVQLLFVEPDAARSYTVFANEVVVARDFNPGNVTGQVGANMTRGATLAWSFVRGAEPWGLRVACVAHDGGNCAIGAMVVGGWWPANVHSCYGYLSGYGWAYDDGDEYVLAHGTGTHQLARTACDMKHGGWTRVFALKGSTDAASASIGDRRNLHQLFLPSNASGLDGFAKMGDDVISDISPSGIFLVRCGNATRYVTNSPGTWASTIANGLDWRVDRDRDGTFECDASQSPTRMLSDATAQPLVTGANCSSSDAIILGSDGRDPAETGCYYAPVGWGQDLEIWAAPPCVGTFLHTGRCVLADARPMTWRSARDFCRYYGGELLRVDVSEDHAEAAALCGGVTATCGTLARECWLGASDLAADGDFRWSQPLAGSLQTNVWYNAAWGAGQPNMTTSGTTGRMHCVTIRTTNGSISLPSSAWTWATADCLTLKRPLCGFPYVDRRLSTDQPPLPDPMTVTGNWGGRVADDLGAASGAALYAPFEQLSWDVGAPGQVLDMTASVAGESSDNYPVNGTAFGSARTGPSGRLAAFARPHGRCLILDGAGSLVSFPYRGSFDPLSSPSAFVPFSVSFWAKGGAAQAAPSAAGSTSATLVEISDGSAGASIPFSFSVTLGTGAVRFVRRDMAGTEVAADSKAGLTAPPAGTVLDDTWHHVAGVQACDSPSSSVPYDAASEGPHGCYLHLYVDGVVADSVAVTDAMTNVSATNGGGGAVPAALFLGASCDTDASDVSVPPSSCSRHFTGSIDELILFTQRALSQADVLALYLAQAAFPLRLSTSGTGVALQAVHVPLPWADAAATCAALRGRLAVTRARYEVDDAADACGAAGDAEGKARTPCWVGLSARGDGRWQGRRAFLWEDGSWFREDESIWGSAVNVTTGAGLVLTSDGTSAVAQGADACVQLNAGNATLVAADCGYSRPFLCDVSAQAGAACPGGWVPGPRNTTCIRAVPAGFLPFANDICRSLGGSNLVTHVSNSSENAALSTLCGAGGSCWLGLHYTSSSGSASAWSWKSRTGYVRLANSTIWTNWATGHGYASYGSCVYLSGTDGLWYESDCGNAGLAGICEMSKSEGTRCAPGWTRFAAGSGRASCVRRVALDWPTAGQVCASVGKGGSLLTLGSREEVDHALDVCPGGWSCWVGLVGVTDASDDLGFASSGNSTFYNIDGRPGPWVADSSLADSSTSMQTPPRCVAVNAYLPSPLWDYPCRGHSWVGAALCSTQPGHRWRGCPLGWQLSPQGGRCVRAFSSSWRGSLDTCAATFGPTASLVSVTNAANNADAATVCGSEECWIGLATGGVALGRDLTDDSHYSLTWANGLPAGATFFSAWAGDGQPPPGPLDFPDGAPEDNVLCVTISGMDAKWRAYPCGEPKAALCQLASTVPTGSTTAVCPTGWRLTRDNAACLRKISGDYAVGARDVCQLNRGDLMGVLSPLDAAIASTACAAVESRLLPSTSLPGRPVLSRGSCFVGLDSTTGAQEGPFANLDGSVFPAALMGGDAGVPVDGIFPWAPVQSSCGVLKAAPERGGGDGGGLGRLGRGICSERRGFVCAREAEESGCGRGAFVLDLGGGNSPTTSIELPMVEFRAISLWVYLDPDASQRLLIATGGNRTIVPFVLDASATVANSQLAMFVAVNDTVTASVAGSWWTRVLINGASWYMQTPRDPFPTGSWFHLYVEGSATARAKVRLFSRSSTLKSGATAMVASIQLWSAPLQDYEVADAFNGGRHRYCHLPLVANFPLHEGRGSTLKDTFGGLSATISGSDITPTAHPSPANARSPTSNEYRWLRSELAGLPLSAHTCACPPSYVLAPITTPVWPPVPYPLGLPQRATPTPGGTGAGGPGNVTGLYLRSLSGASDIDLDGWLPYTVNIGDNGPASGSAAVTWTEDASTDGFQVSLSPYDNATWLSLASPPFVSAGLAAPSGADLALAHVVSSMRTADPSPGTEGGGAVNMTIGRLTPRQLYKVQLLFSEACCDRVFNVLHQGTLVAREFSPRRVPGMPLYLPDGTPVRPGILLSYLFTPEGTSTQVQLWGGGGGGTGPGGGSDPYDPATGALSLPPVLSAVTVESLGPPGLRACYAFHSTPPRDSAGILGAVAINDAIAIETPAVDDVTGGPLQPRHALLLYSRSHVHLWSGNLSVATLPDTLPRQAITVSAWVNLRSAPPARSTLVSLVERPQTGASSNVPERGWFLGFRAHPTIANATAAQAGLVGSAFNKFDVTLTTSVTPAPSLVPRAWHHLAFTWDRRWLRLYVNGTEASSALVEGSAVAYPDGWSGNLAYFTVGRSADTPDASAGVAGWVRDVAVYDVALDAAGVAALAQEYAAPCPLRLVVTVHTSSTLAGASTTTPPLVFAQGANGTTANLTLFSQSFLSSGTSAAFIGSLPFMPANVTITATGASPAGSYDAWAVDAISVSLDGAACALGAPILGASSLPVWVDELPLDGTYVGINATGALTYALGNGVCTDPTAVHQCRLPSYLSRFQHTNISALASASVLGATQPAPHRPSLLGTATWSPSAGSLVVAAGSSAYGRAFTRCQLALGPRSSFYTFFKFQAAGAAPEGLAFVLHNAPGGLVDLPTVNASGAGLGYAGIPASLAIEFDMRSNAAQGFSDGVRDNHIGVTLNGNMSATVANDAGTNMGDGMFYYAWVDFNGTNLRVFQSHCRGRPPVAQIEMGTGSGPLAALPGILANRAYVGFTASTGENSSQVRVLEWSFTVEEARPFTGNRLAQSDRV